MNISFDGVGSLSATFLGGDLPEGCPVKLTAPGTVAACAEGERLCGVTLCCRDDACAVQLRGFVTVPFTGDAPACGYASLTSDGAGGVRAPAAGEDWADYLVADVSAGTVTILL